jgi:hypothetical protein
MMKIFHNLKAGAKYAPALLIITYYFLIFLDLLTTYLASPNLMLEGNWVIRYFKLGWVDIIILSIVSATIITFGLLLSLNYINSFYEQKSDFINNYHSEIFADRRLVMSLVVLVCFYSHFTYSIFLVINNYLSYLYLHRIDNSLSRLANTYISNYILGHFHFYEWILALFVLFGSYISFNRIKQIKQRHFLNRTRS